MCRIINGVTLTPLLRITREILSETPLTYGSTTKVDVDSALALDEQLVLESRWSISSGIYNTVVNVKNVNVCLTSNLRNHPSEGELIY